MAPPWIAVSSVQGQLDGTLARLLRLLRRQTLARKYNTAALTDPLMSMHLVLHPSQGKVHVCFLKSRSLLQDFQRFSSAATVAANCHLFLRYERSFFFEGHTIYARYACHVCLLGQCPSVCLSNPPLLRWADLDQTWDRPYRQPLALKPGGFTRVSFGWAEPDCPAQ